jgi:hypothetical protein
MIAAGFAQPENRAALLSSVGKGGGGSSDAAATMQNLMTLQGKAEAAALKSRQRAQLPDMAKKLGIDLNTATMLFESGKIDELIMQKNKDPETQVVKDESDGSNWLVSKSDGKRISQVTPPDPMHNKVADQKILADINAERAKVNEPPLTQEQYQQRSNTERAPKTVVNTGDNALAGGYAKTYVEDFEAARGSEKVIGRVQNAHDTLDQGIVSGNVLSPAILEGRKLLASAFGLPREAESNTEVFQSQMKEVVLPRIKALGAANSITDTDRKYVDEMVAASPTLTPEAAKRILTILEKGERNEITRYNQNIDKLAATNPEGAKAARRIDVPQPSRQLLASVPAPAVERLKKDASPEVIRLFDQKYGAGMSQLFLGAR